MSSAGPLALSEIIGMAPSTSAGAPAGQSADVACESVPLPAGAAAAGAPSDRYEKLEKLGEGTYGVVYRARDKLLRRDVALKKIRMNAWADGVPATALREICALKELSGGAAAGASRAHVVAMHDVFVSVSGNLYLVFELLERDLKSVLDPLRARGGLPPEAVRSYMYQLLLAVEACHSRRMVHRDIKPQNILLGGSPRLPPPSAEPRAAASAASIAAAAAAALPPLLKLADFGLARTFGLPLRAYTHEVITLWYRCPEVLLGQEVYSAAVDIWSCGCIFGEMAAGQPLFTGGSEIEQLYRTFRVLGTPSAADWPLLTALPEHSAAFPAWPRKPAHLVVPALCEQGRDLLYAMLAYDPARRISAAEARAHPYFAPLRAAAAEAEARAAAADAGAGAGGAVATPGAPAAAAGAAARRPAAVPPPPELDEAMGEA